MNGTTPIRHQLKRTKGYRKPEGVVSVTRPGLWGNPYSTASAFRNIFKAIWDAEHGGSPIDMTIDSESRHRILWMVRNIETLRGKDVACWCRQDASCHADILLEFANLTMADDRNVSRQ